MYKWLSNTFINIGFFNVVFKNFGQNLDHFGINRRPQDVKTINSQRQGDVLKTNFWTSRNGHFAAWVVTNHGEGEPTKRMSGGQVKFFPYEKGEGKVLAMLKRGHK